MPTRAITVGFACNNACVFCAQGERRAGSRPDIDAQLAAITAGDVVAFQGGEPTIHDDLPAWIRAAVARGAARVIVQTNGRRLAYKSYAIALREAAPVLVLDVSLHGSSAAMHEYHTGVPDSFAHTMLGLRHARAARIPFGVTTVITRSSFRHLPEIVRLAHSAGAAAIHLADALPFGRAARDRARVIPAEAMVAPYRSRAVAEAQRLGLAVIVGDRTWEPAAAPIFAGIGEVEALLPEASSPRKVSLPIAVGVDAPRGEE
ncbi:Radical SAM domain heme biosynthesis protein [Minicystis rosea]|nr:Radical SAM domain heme biosynthesis protein [Minicystis rosea]